MRTNTNIQRCTEIIAWDILVDEAGTLVVAVLAVPETLEIPADREITLAVMDTLKESVVDPDTEKATMITVKPDAIIVKQNPRNIRKK